MGRSRTVRAGEGRQGLAARAWNTRSALIAAPGGRGPRNPSLEGTPVMTRRDGLAQSRSSRFT